MPSMPLHGVHAIYSGLSYLGSNHRLRAALRKALEGKEVLKIGVIGGDDEDAVQLAKE